MNLPLVTVSSLSGGICASFRRSDSEYSVGLLTKFTIESAAQTPATAQSPHVFPLFLTV